MHEQSFAIAVLSILPGRPAGVAALAPGAGRHVVHDGHFHLTNYIQEGTDIRDFLKIMGTKVGRVALFGIPLQQTWAYGNSGDFAPTYYLQTTRRSTTTPSPTPPSRWRTGR